MVNLIVSMEIVRRYSLYSLYSHTFYGNFIIKLAWKLSGNLIYNVCPTKTPDKVHNFYIIWRQHNFSSDSTLLLLL